MKMTYNTCLSNGLKLLTKLPSLYSGLVSVEVISCISAPDTGVA